MRAPAFYAERVLDELGIDRVEDLYCLSEIAWARGALVDERDITGAEARLSTLGGRAVISVSTGIHDIHRRRFAIAHELGHYEMRHQLAASGCSTDDLEQWARGSRQRAIEYQSNEFAADLLLPRRFAAPYCVTDTPCLDHVAEIAQVFQASLTATAIRFVDLGEDCTAVVYSRAGNIEWFHGSPDFRELGLFIPVGERTQVGSIADRIFAGKIVSRQPQRVRATEWLVSRDIHLGAQATLVEQSWAMPSFDAVLTLLCIDDELDSDL